ncbi:MAG: hypothetical protein R3C02_11290 [Planctomycetaceae bacterium]
MSTPISEAVGMVCSQPICLMPLMVALPDEDGLIRMRAVADYVQSGVNQWIDDMNTI